MEQSSENVKYDATHLSDGDIFDKTVLSSYGGINDQNFKTSNEERQFKRSINRSSTVHNRAIYAQGIVDAELFSRICSNCIHKNTPFTS